MLLIFLKYNCGHQHIQKIFKLDCFLSRTIIKFVAIIMAGTLYIYAENNKYSLIKQPFIRFRFYLTTWNCHVFPYPCSYVEFAKACTNAIFEAEKIFEAIQNNLKQSAICEEIGKLAVFIIREKILTKSYAKRLGKDRLRH